MKKLIIGGFAILNLWGCAQFIPPTGGKKDIIAPKLVSSNPKNQTINFKDKSIDIEMDEFIETTSLKQELLITPNPEGTFEVKNKGKAVKLIFEKPFLPNTTYTLNFRNGIKDVNEKNPSKNLKLIFSTGKKIDSLKLSGTITQLMTNKPALEALVGLYELNDTLVYYKRKPKYFIKTDSSGKYEFENIKNGKYQVMAFTDKNNNLKFDERNEMMGFVRDTINLETNKEKVNIKIYPYDHKNPKLKRTVQRSEYYSLQFDKGIKNYKVEFKNKLDSIPYKAEAQSITFFNYPTKKDTIGVKVFAIDSVDNHLELNQKIKFAENENKKTIKRKFNVDIKQKNGTEIDKPIIYNLNFEFPLIAIQKEKIHIQKDTINKIKIDSIIVSPTQTEIKLVAKGDSLKDLSHLIIEAGAFVNIYSDTNTVIKSKNIIAIEEDFGKLEGTIENKKGVNKIIQLINEETQKVVLEERTKIKYSFKKVKPASYIIRIIDDVNNNGRWDMGDLEKNQIAEMVSVFNTIIKIKSNFEIVQNIKEE